MAKSKVPGPFGASGLGGWLGLAVGAALVGLIFDWQRGVIVIVGTLIGIGLAWLTQSWRGRFSSNPTDPVLPA